MLDNAFWGLYLCIRSPQSNTEFHGVKNYHPDGTHETQKF